MTFDEIFKRIGKQPLSFNRRHHALIFIGDKEFEITSMQYENGVLKGFNAKEIKKKEDITWYKVKDYPEKDRYILVKNKVGITSYDLHSWNGMCYYVWVPDGEGGCDGWRTTFEIEEWRYATKKEINDYFC